MKKATQFAIGAGLFVAIAVLAVVSIFLLPSEVGMQLTSSGEIDNFFPKWLAITLPAAVGDGCALVFSFKKINACAIVAAVMIAAQILTLIFNL